MNEKSIADRYLEAREYELVVDNDDIKIYESDSAAVNYYLTDRHDGCGNWAISFTSKFPDSFAQLAARKEDDIYYFNSDIFIIPNMVAFMLKFEELNGIPILSPEMRAAVQHFLDDLSSEEVKEVEKK